MLISMKTLYIWVLVGLSNFTMFAIWEIQRQSLLTAISQRTCSNGRNTSDDFAQNSQNNTRKPRILCWIPTGPDYHMSRSIHVKRTWGSRCDKLLFISSTEDHRLGTVVIQGVLEGHEKLWPKVQKGFQYVWKHHRSDADWFMKADDDTYVLMDNLRMFLKDFDSNDPHYFGSPVQFFDNAAPINFGGAGYILSKEALRRFVEVALVVGGDCFTGFRPDFKGDEDTEIGLCLRSVGVPTEWTRDEQDRDRFLKSNPFMMFDNISSDYETSWKSGPVTMSNRAISFHYLQPKDFYIFEYLTYFLKTDY